MAEHLSENFTLEELIYSDTAKARGIDNTPTEVHKKILIHTAQYLLEPLRKLLNNKYREYAGKKVKYVALKITSGYRGAKLNTYVGGVKTSQHCNGSACDVEARIVFIDGTKCVLPYTELYENIKTWVKEEKLSVDQCIQEKSGSAVWVHVSHHPSGKKLDRRQFLKYDGIRYTLDVQLR